MKHAAKIYISVTQHHAHLEMIRILKEVLSKHPATEIHSYLPERGMIILSIDVNKKAREKAA